MKYLLLPISFLFALLLFTPSSASALCAGVPATGDYTVTADCTFSGMDGVGGVDNGNLIVNAGTILTINTNETVAWNNGFSVTVNGTILKSASGAVLKKTNLWAVDSDGDGYSSDLVFVAQDTSPGGTYVRRNTLSTMSLTDVNDGDNTCARNRYSSTVTNCIAPSVECVVDEAGYQDTVPMFKVFVSSSVSSGILGGAAGADTTCDTLAGSGSYTAWLTESNSLEPVDRGLSGCVTAGSSSVAWYLPDNVTKVADNWTDLTDGTLDAAINQYEDGTTASGTTSVWTYTGTDGSGLNGSAHCKAWTTDIINGKGDVGLRTSTTTTWSDNSNATSCAEDLRIYCFQDS